MKNTLLLLCLISLQVKAQTFLRYNRSVVQSYVTLEDKAGNKLRDSSFVDTVYLYNGVIQFQSKSEYAYYDYIPRKNERRIQKANYRAIGNKIELVGKFLKGSIHNDSLLDYRKLPEGAQDFILFPISPSTSNFNFDCCWSVSSTIFDANIIFKSNPEIQTVIVTKKPAMSFREYRVTNGQFEWGNRVEFDVKFVTIGEEVFFLKNDSSIYLLEGRLYNDKSIITKFNLEKSKPKDTYSLKEVASKFLGYWQVSPSSCDYDKDISLELTFSNEAVISKTYFKDTNYNRYDTYSWSVGQTGNFISMQIKDQKPRIFRIKEIRDNQIILESGSCDFIYTRKD